MVTADAVEEWIRDDPDPSTVAELVPLLESLRAGDTAAEAELESRFSGMLEFGTAGLRGEIGAGPMRMNRAVVIRAAAGLAGYMTDALVAQGASNHTATVVVCFDARHRSRDFAIDTCAVLEGAGHQALLLPGPLPTPVLAYAVSALSADAGVMVTASHNPARDNGYKVYLGGRIVPDEGKGAQLVSPHDREIARRMQAVRSVRSVSHPDSGWAEVHTDTVDQYVESVAGLIAAPEGDLAEQRAALRIVLTPLHGVGAETVERVLHAAGFTDLHTVPEQAEPDPDFPTVDFPNPEEKGAMDLALALADELEAHIVIANDPDTDRCAVAVRIQGRWTMLHGDRVGALLGERMGASLAAAGVPDGATFASSIVSSQQLASIAKAHGVAYQSTLTGFKWIGRVPGLVYGYEEALGYCVAPELVRDKDGISAALFIADFAAELHAKEMSLENALEMLDEKYGVFLSEQVSARFGDLSMITQTMSALLKAPPTELGGSTVHSVEDMNKGIDGLGPTNGIRLVTLDGARVIIRPSGTEPKVKAYLEVQVPVTSAQALPAARAEARAAMDELANDVHKLLGL